MTFHRVTRKRPCAVCGKPDWCTYTDEGWAHCMRCSVPPAGLVRHKNSLEGGTIFRPMDGSLTPQVSVAPTPKLSFTYPTCQSAIAQAERKCNGKHVASWTYTDADGKECFVVARFDQADGKKVFRPFHYNGTGYLIADPPEPLPLYCLHELKGASRRYVTEGEKAADAAIGIGLIATTSAHGSKSPDKTDWSPIAGGEVIILLDNDKDGEAFGTKVTQILHALDPSTVVKIVRFPDLPPKADIVEFIEARRNEGASDEDIRMELESLADAAPPASVSSASGEEAPIDIGWPEVHPLPDALPPVMKFDPKLLPENLRDWVVDIADRMQCAIDYVAVAVIVALATAVGRRVAIRPKRYDVWTVVANLWGAVIGRPGTLKSPAIQEALQPLFRLEAKAKEEFKERQRNAEAAKLVADAKKRKLNQEIRDALNDSDDEAEAQRIARDWLDVEAEDGEPTRKRLIVNDVTVEKLGVLLNENPMGLMLYRDELVGALKNLEKDGQEGARSFYLEAWNGTGSFTFDRIGRGTLDIQAAVLSILGGIQPGPFRQYLRAIAKEGAGDDGLVQRFQITVWPDRPAEWHNVDRLPDEDARKRAEQIFEWLNTLDPVIVQADPSPHDPAGIPFLHFADDAQNLFDEWRAGLESRLQGDLPAAFESHLAKYRSLVPSLALVFHLADGGKGPVLLAALQKAIGWAAYLESHAGRVYAHALHPDREAAHVLATKILAGALGTAFVERDLKRKGWTGLTDGSDVRGAIEVLVDYGWLVPCLLETGGRRTTRYWINPGVHALRESDSRPNRTAEADESPSKETSGSNGSADTGGDA